MAIETALGILTVGWDGLGWVVAFSLQRKER